MVSIKNRQLVVELDGKMGYVPESHLEKKPSDNPSNERASNERASSERVVKLDTGVLDAVNISLIRRTP